MDLTGFSLLGMDFHTLLYKGVTLVVVLAAALVAQRVVVRVTTKALETANVPSASILVNVCRALIWSFALLMVLQPVFGIEPTAFVAALGVTSVALSLGLQDTISNLIGGLALMTGKVIQPGDVISVGGVTGSVKDITWRSTTIGVRGGNLQVIPNSVLSKTALTKLAPGAATEARLPVTLVSGTDLEQVRVDAEIAAREALGTLYDEEHALSVQVTAFDAYGTQAYLSIHVLEGMAFSAACTAVAERVAGAPWLVRPALDGSGDPEQ